MYVTLRGSHDVRLAKHLGAAAAERLFNATSRQAAIAELRSILYGEIKIDPAKLKVRGP